MTAASNSEARKRQQAREAAQPTATATNEGAVGAEVVGRLTEAERDLLWTWWNSDWPTTRDHTLDTLAGVVASILRDHAERAWDEGYRAGWDDRHEDEDNPLPAGEQHDAPNPYARQEPTDD